MVDMIQFAKIALSFEDKDIPIKHIEGPMGVRGRNSNNKLIMEKLGWEPTITIAEGLNKTYFWIKSQIEEEAKAGKDAAVTPTLRLFNRLTILSWHLVTTRALQWKEPSKKHKDNALVFAVDHCCHLLFV
jgi:hypothetical protein